MQHSTVHRTYIQPSTVISKNDSKKCVHFGTTARVIRVGAYILNKLQYPFYTERALSIRWETIRLSKANKGRILDNSDQMS